MYFQSEFECVNYAAAEPSIRKQMRNNNYKNHNDTKFYK